MTSDPSRDPDPDTLEGEVVAVVFTNPASGFGVVEVSGDEDSARATGPLTDLVEGQAVRLQGRWVDHPRYGPTFQATGYELAAPRSESGLIVFLASERFPGVGVKTARALVERFGLELEEVIRDDPARLAQAPGVSAAMATRVAAGWEQAGALAALVRRLSSAGLSASAAQGVHRRFGERALTVLETDPYAVLDVRGVGWDQAERLAADYGVAADDPRRLAAGVVVAHQRVAAARGHVALTDAELVAEARGLLRVDQARVRAGIERAAGRRRLIRDRPPGASAQDAGESEPDDAWYLPADLAAERGLAREFARLARARSRVAGPARKADLDEALTEEQALAVTRALSAAVSVLTGGPGTGKTRTVCELVRACADADLRVALCAPTGRAAKRMEELTDHGATTVHRLLEARPSDDHGGFAFTYGPEKQLPQDVIVADEWSMADLRLAWALVQAVDDGAHLVLVGDADQLPSVGPGAVLRDLLRAAASGPPEETGVTATTLTRIHRQAAASRIVTLAHEIDAGQVPELRGRDGDVFVVPERPHQIAGRVAEIVAVRVPAFYDGLTPADVQVLAPMYKGPAGVDALNATIKERLNPAAGRAAVAGFHEGDRVVQTRNDAEREVANGDIGEIVAVDSRAKSLSVAYAFGVVEYDPEALADLRPAWALTVHKSQGGEWPVVVLVLDAAHRRMLWRELVYTAVTRAARGLLLVGDAHLLARAARRTGLGAAERRTHLVARLAHELRPDDDA